MAKTNPVSDALVRLGFKTVRQQAYGQWEDYAVSFRHSAPYYYMDVAIREDRKEKASARSLRTKLKERFPKTLLGCVNNGNHMTFSMTFHKNSAYESLLREILTAVTTEMKAQGIAPADTCAVCGREHPDSFSLLGSYQPVHAACVRTEKTAAVQPSAQEQKKNYLTGILGAVIGMLIGLIPSMLSLQLFDRIYSALYILVPLFSLLGYRRFHGKLGALALMIVAVLSLGGVVLLEFLAVTLSFKQELGMTLLPAMKYTLNVLFNRVGVGVMIQESITELFFMAAGIFLSWLFLLPHPGHGKAAMRETANRTLQPMNGSLDDPDWLEK